MSLPIFNNPPIHSAMFMATVSDYREKIEVLYGESKEENGEPVQIYMSSNIQTNGIDGVDDGKPRKKGLEALLWEAKEIEEIVKQTTDIKNIVSSSRKKPTYEHQPDNDDDDEYLPIQRRAINERSSGTWCVLVLSAIPEVSDEQPQIVQKIYWEHKVGSIDQ